ncbi:hypothetical protein PTW35_17815 (plasmid) [Photobacterium sp. DA100]|uniref:hypothetical protein n=1 Tax=Photobacterium sp. DA100 TaxID=3027472 RepID=UPI002478497A|nr:hypothetical protein [Photobacterium sp. DA100]WEM44962.1 hypothetical protein PTW35_17815 [Photobacterium sp. DA100]
MVQSPIEKRLTLITASDNDKPRNNTGRLVHQSHAAGISVIGPISLAKLPTVFVDNTKQAFKNSRLVFSRQ